MPFADVSEIIGKRDLVGEAQQWAQLGLEKRKLAMLEEKAQEQSKVKNYQFNQAEFGVDNPYFSDQMRQLNDKSYQWVLANSHLLKIDPTSPDATEEVKNAHRINANLQMSAKQISAVSTNLKNKYKSNRDKMNNTQSGHLYNTVDNHDIMSGIENLYKTFGADGSMYFDIDFSTGNLVINQRQKMQIQERNENGELIFINSNGEKVTQDDDAYDENSQPSMVEGDQWDEENINSMSINDWSNSVLKDVTPNDPDKIVSYKDTFRIIKSSASEQNPSGVLNEREMKDLIKNKIVGSSGTGIYDPEGGQFLLTQDGTRILNDWRLQNPGQDEPSLKDLIQFAYERAEAEFHTSQAQRYKPPVQPKVKEVDLGIYKNVNLYNELYKNSESIQGNHNISSPIAIGTPTGGIKTTMSLSGDIYIPGHEDSLQEFINSKEGGNHSGKNLDVVVHNVGIKRTAVKDGKEFYLTSAQEKMSAEELKKLGITAGDWVQVAVGTLSATVNGELDENLYSLMQQYGIMGKDGTKSGSTTIIIPMGKVSGKLPKDDGYVFNVLDKIQKQRNSASGGGASKFNK